MSEDTLINKIIETLEKSQNVKIWDATNEIPSVTIDKIRKFLNDYADTKINVHILKKFGVL